MGLINAPIISTTFMDTIRFAPIIKGSREGINMFTHMFMPFLAAKIESLGKITMPMISIITISFGKKYLVNFDIYIKSPINKRL